MRIISPKPDFWECRYRKGASSRRLLVHLTNSKVQVIDGPEDSTARCHEEMGGMQSFEEFLERPAPWSRDFPELVDLVRRAIEERLGH